MEGDGAADELSTRGGLGLGGSGTACTTVVGLEGLGDSGDACTSVVGLEGLGDSGDACTTVVGLEELGVSGDACTTVALCCVVGLEDVVDTIFFGACVMMHLPAAYWSKNNILYYINETHNFKIIKLSTILKSKASKFTKTEGRWTYLGGGCVGCDLGA